MDGQEGAAGPSTSASVPNPAIPDEPTASTSNIAEQPPMSKNAAKKLAKRLAFEAAKPARRARERAMKKEKAAEKRKLVELGVIEKPVSKRQLQSRPKTPFNARIVIDCGFDDKMSEKDIKSMASQVGYCYSVNRTARSPVSLLVSSLNGQLKQKLDDNQGVYQTWRGMEWWEESYEDLWATSEGEKPSTQLGSLKGKAKATSAKEDVIYLTGDSTNVLDAFEEGKTYIIGGIVDHNKYKNLCLKKAEEQGIRHAQLPIEQYLPQMLTRKVLTVNQVFEIVTRWTEHRDWLTALQAVMPQRKFETNGKKQHKTTYGEGELEDNGGAGEKGEPREVHQAVDEDDASATEEIEQPSTGTPLQEVVYFYTQ